MSRFLTRSIALLTITATFLPLVATAAPKPPEHRGTGRNTATIVDDYKVPDVGGPGTSRGTSTR